MERFGFILGEVTRGAGKLVLPVTKSVAKMTTSFASGFAKGLVEQPTLNDNQIDEELKQELSSEPGQPELPLEHPEQSARQS